MSAPMEDQEAILHLLSALRQRSRAAVDGIERIAKRRLHDLPARHWHQDIIDMYAEAGKTLPDRWNLSSLEDIGCLLGDLERQHKPLGNKSPRTQKQRNILRWYPAVVVLRHCFHIREFGYMADYVNVLHVSALSMWDYERRIGTDIRKKSDNASASSKNVRRSQSDEKIRKVAEHLALLEQKGKPRNVIEACRRAGRDMGLPPGSLRKMWYQHLKKLSPSAGQ
jgi:hypothetical protein